MSARGGCARGPARGARHSVGARALAGAALARALTLVALAALPACSLFGPPPLNDPKTRAVASLEVALGLPQLAATVSGEGQLVLRLMPEALGEAIEAELYWRRAPGEPPRFVTKPDRTPDALALFEGMRPDRYRLTSFAWTARYENERSSEPIQIALTGTFDGIAHAPVQVGEVVHLGGLALDIFPDQTYAYTLRAPTSTGPVLAAQRARADLARLAPTARPLGTKRPTDASADSPRAPRGAPPSVGAAAVALEMRAHGVVSEAISGAGQIALVIRKVGAGAATERFEVAWRLAPSASAQAPESAKDDGAADALPRFRAVNLERPAATLPLSGGAVALPLLLPVGEYELVDVVVAGALLDPHGQERPIAASASVPAGTLFRVLPDSVSDLGRARLDLASRSRARFQALPANAAASATASADAVAGPGGPVPETFLRYASPLPRRGEVLE